jgi:hypothetical protein
MRASMGSSKKEATNDLQVCCCRRGSCAHVCGLRIAPDVKGLDVKVETDKAVVQLSGFVASQAQIDKAVEVAKGVRGVREVQNKMSVKPG